MNYLELLGDPRRLLSLTYDGGVRRLAAVSAKDILGVCVGYKHI